MNFSLDTNAGINAINAYDDNGIEISGRWHKTHLLLTPDAIIENWQPQPAQQLTLNDLQAILQPAPHILVLGTGKQLQFPPAKLTADLAGLGTGLEVMSTEAACRTFNILLSEGRSVAAALMFWE